jgi:NADH-quinone oxidoreductase subunit A
MHVGAETSPWGVFFYLALTAVVLATMLLLPVVLGQRHRERTTGERYESGLPPASDMPRRYSIEFYLVAILFVVFDLEAAFIFAWAVVARHVGWTGYTVLAVFVGILLAGLAYEWKTGRLDWGTDARRRRRGRMPP